MSRIVQEILSDAIVFGFFVTYLLHPVFLYLVKTGIRQTHYDGRMGGNDKLGIMAAYCLHDKG